MLANLIEFFKSPTGIAVSAGFVLVVGRGIYKIRQLKNLPPPPPPPEGDDWPINELIPHETADEDTACWPPRSKSTKAVSVRALIRANGELINNICVASSLSEDEYRRFLIPVIVNLGKVVHQLPASEYHHHQGYGGLFRHSLEVAFYAANQAKCTIFDRASSPKIMHKNRRRWILACILAALLHDIGKAYTDMNVTTADGKIWTKVKPLVEWLRAKNVEEYFVAFIDDRQHNAHMDASGRHYLSLIPVGTQSFLSNAGLNSKLIQAIGDAIQKGAAGGLVGKILVEADKHSVEVDTLRQRKIQSSEKNVANPQGDQILKAIRAIINNSRWTVNLDKSSQVFNTRAGCFIALTDTVAEQIWNQANLMGFTGLPKNSAAIAQILTDCKAALANVETIYNHTFSNFWEVNPIILENDTVMCVKMKDPAYIFDSVAPPMIEAVVTDVPVAEETVKAWEAAWGHPPRERVTDMDLLDLAKQEAAALVQRRQEWLEVEESAAKDGTAFASEEEAFRVLGFGEDLTTDKKAATANAVQESATAATNQAKTEAAATAPETTQPSPAAQQAPLPANWGFPHEETLKEEEKEPRAPQVTHEGVNGNALPVKQATANGTANEKTESGEKAAKAAKAQPSQQEPVQAADPSIPHEQVTGKVSTGEDPQHADAAPKLPPDLPPDLDAAWDAAAVEDDAPVDVPVDADIGIGTDIGVEEPKEPMMAAPGFAHEAVMGNFEHEAFTGNSLPPDDAAVSPDVPAASAASHATSNAASLPAVDEITGNSAVSDPDQSMQPPAQTSFAVKESGAAANIEIAADEVPLRGDEQPNRGLKGKNVPTDEWDNVGKAEVMTKQKAFDRRREAKERDTAEWNEAFRNGADEGRLLSERLHQAQNAARKEESKLQEVKKTFDMGILMPGAEPPARRAASGRPTNAVRRQGNTGKDDFAHEACKGRPSQPQPDTIVADDDDNGSAIASSESCRIQRPLKSSQAVEKAMQAVFDSENAATKKATSSPVKAKRMSAKAREAEVRKLYDRLLEQMKTGAGDLVPDAGLDMRRGIRTAGTAIVEAECKKLGVDITALTLIADDNKSHGMEIDAIGKRIYIRA